MATGKPHFEHICVLLVGRQLAVSIEDSTFQRVLAGRNAIPPFEGLQWKSASVYVEYWECPNMKKFFLAAIGAIFLPALVSAPCGCGGSTEAVRSENPVQDEQPPEHDNYKRPA